MKAIVLGAALLLASGTAHAQQGPQWTILAAKMHPGRPSAVRLYGQFGSLAECVAHNHGVRVAGPMPLPGGYAYQRSCEMILEESP